MDSFIGTVKSIILLLLAVVLLTWGYNSTVGNRYTKNQPEIIKDSYGIVAFGDSLIEGIGAKNSYGFVSRLSESLEVDIYNAGKRGMTTSEALEAVQTEVINFEPKIVIVSIGANDLMLGGNINETRANIFRVVDQITSNGAHVVFLGISKEALGGNFEKTYTELEQYFGENITVVADFYQPIMFKPRYLFDPLHPNDAGHQLLAENIEPIIRELLINL